MATAIFLGLLSISYSIQSTIAESPSEEMYVFNGAGLFLVAFILYDILNARFCNK